jgi:hypothetical protein
MVRLISARLLLDRCGKDLRLPSSCRSISGAEVTAGRATEGEVGVAGAGANALGDDERERIVLEVVMEGTATAANVDADVEGSAWSTSMFIAYSSRFTLDASPPVNRHSTLPSAREPDIAFDPRSHSRSNIAEG